ncbi:MAG: helix-turn-helix domain-containing protein [Rhodospirillaceae bacterium]|nr:helix-turn-helix domain-containing protein [Rhodospirillaceae bacterium]
MPRGIRQRAGRDGTIYAEGDAAANWYRLISGSVRVFRVLADGRRHIGEFVFPGDMFGFEPGQTHIQGAEAIEPAEFVAYPIAAIERCIVGDAAVRHAIRALLVERLAAAQNRVMALGRLTAAERLADFLLGMARRGDGRFADMPMSRVDVADYLGLTVETLSRLFTNLRQRGIIRLPNAYHVEILDRAALVAASGHSADPAAADFD